MSGDEEDWAHERAINAVNSYYPAGGSPGSGKEDVIRWLESAAAALRTDRMFNRYTPPGVVAGTMASAGELDAARLDAETWSARATEAEAKLAGLTDLEDSIGELGKRILLLEEWCDELKKELVAAEALIAAKHETIAVLTSSFEELRATALECERAMGAVEAENSVLLDTIAERNQEISALVAAIRRDEEEIQRLRSVMPSRRATSEWKKP